MYIQPKSYIRNYMSVNWTRNKIWRVWWGPLLVGDLGPGPPGPPPPINPALKLETSAGPPRRHFNFVGSHMPTLPRPPGRVFSTSREVLRFELDFELWKFNSISKTWHRCRTNIMISTLYFSRNHERNERTNQPTNKRPITIPPGGSNHRL